MIVERENNEILVRFTASKNASRIQSILDYLRYEELTSKSKATEKDADELVKESKSNRWEKIRKALDSMTKLIVDSNIIFTAILNVNSRIGQILLTSDGFYDFYAPKYIRDEIINHQEKLKKIAKLESNDFLEVYELVLKNITILDHSIPEKKNYQKAFELCENVDLDDIPFVAFSLYLKCKLWTGDKKLIKGLKDNGFDKIVTTNDLFKDLLKKEQKVNNTCANRT